jgi:predicted acyl esterase
VKSFAASRFFRFCDGAVRASYAAGWNRQPLQTGEIRPAEILLGHVRYTIPSGHRLVAEFSGSAFPKYDVNHGTCARPASDPVMVNSCVTLYPENRDGFFLDLPLC